MTHIDVDSFHLDVSYYQNEFHFMHLLLIYEILTYGSREKWVLWVIKYDTCYKLIVLIFTI